MTVNLIALTGPQGEIGHSDGTRIVMGDVRASMDWFLETVEGGIVVVGRKSVDQMIEDGVDIMRLPYLMAVFTRHRVTLTVESYIHLLRKTHPERPIFVAGGKQTYEAFLPFCSNFFIRKTHVAGSPDLFLPPLFAPKGTIH